MPSVSILAEPPVALVDTVVDRRGTRQIAEAYLRLSCTRRRARRSSRETYFRPRDPQVLAKYASSSRRSSMFTVDQVFGGWTEAHDRHFADGGVFDQDLRRARSDQ